MGPGESSPIHSALFGLSRMHELMGLLMGTGGTCEAPEHCESSPLEGCSEPVLAQEFPIRGAGTCSLTDTMGTQRGSMETPCRAHA